MTTRDDLVRTISDNDLHVTMTQFIESAESIHIAMCRFESDHYAQTFLNKAMQSVLIGAQECTKLHASAKVRMPRKNLDQYDE